MSPSTPEHAAPAADQSRWFSEEIYPHEASLRFHLRNAFPTVRDVDDVVQESYLRIWKARAVQPVRSAKSFLFMIARRLAIDVLRRQRISPEVALPDLAALRVLEDRPGVAETACTRDELAWLARALHALPGRCREVMMLRQIEGVPQKEIARRLGLSELTVQTHVVHGLRRLEAYFRKHGAMRTRS